MNQHKQFIEKLSKKRANYNDAEQAFSQAQALHLLSKDIYTDRKRFIYELLQNADDASNSKNTLQVAIHFLDNFLIVAHKGEAFTEIDIESLSSTGDGVKRTQAKKTGFKGIGFKSVFNHSDYVIIKSENYCFRFDAEYWTENGFANTWKPNWGSITDWQKERERKGLELTPKMPWQMIPIWTELPEELSSLALFDEYSVCTIIRYKSKQETSKLEENLTELFKDINLILFLRCQNIEITIAKNQQKILTIEKSFDENTQTLQLTENGALHSEWLMRNQNFLIENDMKIALQTDDKAPQRLKEATETDLQFAIPLENGRIMSIAKNDRIIFTYLPTGINFDFPFLLNGSFLTDAGREKLHTNNDWNNYLFQKTAFYFFEWIAELAHKNSPYKQDFLAVIPNKLDASNPFASDFNNSYVKAINEIAFLPNMNGDLLKVGEAVLDETNLSSFIDKQIIIDFINKSESKYAINSFLQWLLPISTLRKLGVHFFAVDNLSDFFRSDIFKKQHKIHENFALIEFLHKQSNRGRENEKWDTTLKEIAFIFDQNSQLQSPQFIYFPSIANINEFSGEISTIHQDITTKIEANPYIKNWLENLGVQEYSDISFIEKTIFSQGDTFVTTKNAIQVGRYVFKAHKEGKLSSDHYNKLRNLPILTNGNAVKIADETYLSSFYEPELDLQAVYKNTDFFVSELYFHSNDQKVHWNEFFRKIGVEQNIKWKKFYVDIDTYVGRRDVAFFSPIFAELKTSKYNYTAYYSGNVYTFVPKTIHFFVFSFILPLTNNYEGAKLFWSSVLKQPFKKENDITSWGACGFERNVGRTVENKNYFDWIIRNLECFPTTNKATKKMCNTFSNNIPKIKEIAGKYLPVFDCEEAISPDWARVLKFEEVLRLEDYLSILRGIANDDIRDEYQQRENQKRVILVYEKIAELNLQAEDKAKLYKWGTSYGNKLMSTSSSFYPPKELYLVVDVEGFKAKNLVYIGKSTDKIVEVLRLFGVNIIDTISEYISDSKVEIQELKTKLSQIAPLISLLATNSEANRNWKQEQDKILFAISNAHFYKTDEIYISYGNEEDKQKRSSWVRENNFYYVGDWKSPRILDGIIDPLAKFLTINKDAARLLGVLLYEPYKEGLEFLKEKGFTVPDGFPLELQIDEVKTQPAATVNQTNEERLRDIGREGEKFVYSELKRIYTNKYNATIQETDSGFKIGNQLEVFWRNKNTNTTENHDFKVIDGGKEMFIDSKATTLGKNVEKVELFITGNELDLMERVDKYLIARVFNVEGANVSVEWVQLKVNSPEENK